MGPAARALVVPQERRLTPRLLTRAERAAAQRGSAASGHWWTAVLVGVGFVMSLVGLGKIAYYLFAPAAIGVTLWLLWRRRWYAYLALTAWMWILTPFMRRVIEWHAGYHSSSLILIPPAVAGLIGIPVALAHRRKVDRTIGAVFVLAFGTFIYGALVGAMRNGVYGAAVDILAIIGPFGAGLFALTVPDDPARLRKTVVQIAVWGSIIIGLYGVIQFFIVPTWDAQWMIDSGVATVGKPRPGAIRVFSTLNDPTPYALVLAPMMLVALLDRRLWVKIAVWVAGVPGLGFSLVRTAWLSISVAALGLLNNGRIKGRMVVAAVVAALVALAIVGGTAAEALYNRVDKSVSSGSQDTSVKARLNFQSSIVGPTLANPIGRGMGSTGTALKLGNAQTNDPRYRSVDSGVFENATTYGSVLGLVLVFALVLGNVSAWWRARMGHLEVMYYAAGITLLMVAMFFVNTIKNAPGFVLWLLLALSARAVTPLPSLDEVRLDRRGEPGAAGATGEADPAPRTPQPREPEPAGLS